MYKYDVFFIGHLLLGRRKYNKMMSNGANMAGLPYSTVLVGRARLARDDEMTRERLIEWQRICILIT